MDSSIRSSPFVKRSEHCRPGWLIWMIASEPPFFVAVMAGLKASTASHVLFLQQIALPSPSSKVAVRYIEDQSDGSPRAASSGQSTAQLEMCTFPKMFMPRPEAAHLSYKRVSGRPSAISLSMAIQSGAKLTFGSGLPSRSGVIG